MSKTFTANINLLEDHEFREHVKTPIACQYRAEARTIFNEVYRSEMDRLVDKTAQAAITKYLSNSWDAQKRVREAVDAALREIAVAELMKNMGAKA